MKVGSLEEIVRNYLSSRLGLVGLNKAVSSGSGLGIPKKLRGRLLTFKTEDFVETRDDYLLTRDSQNQKDVPNFKEEGGRSVASFRVKSKCDAKTYLATFFTSEVRSISLTLLNLCMS